MNAMARRGNRQKNGLNVRSSSDKKGVSPGLSPLTSQQDGSNNANDEEVVLGEELSNGNCSVSSTKSIDDMNSVQVGDSRKNTRESQRKDRKDSCGIIPSDEGPYNGNTEVEKNDSAEVSSIKDGNDLSHILNSDIMNGFGNLSNGLHRDSVENTEFPETAVFKFLRRIALWVAKSSADWVERHKPTFVSLKSNTFKARDYVQMKIQEARPVIYRWIMRIGSIILLLFMVWLDCALRGIDSLLRMGTTSFFSILWFSVLSVIAMAGIKKVLLTLAAAAAVGLFVGFFPAVLLTGLVGTLFLWLYGSFWTTGFIIFLGGLAFIMSHDRIALFTTSGYALYCAWGYVGWLGLVLGMNLSFISSDALLFFLRNIIAEQGARNSSPEQGTGFQGQQSFSHNESGFSSPLDSRTTGQTDRSQGMPSTSGTDSEMTSEDEVVRLLNCSDHYAAVGLSRYENIDVSFLKREYRKKAMLVHPDKNMGNEKAAEAFKKLQNAYEVLLDTVKRKEYDDELRKKELLDYFYKFQNASHKNKGHGLFKSNFAHSDADGDDPLGESRRIACRKCGLFHLWVYSKKTKSKARWCQECKDFHQAKDGDGWVEQASKPLFFGLMQQVEAPSAYVCADGKIYDASEWYICQGLRCPANTHKPSFHVNTSVVSKTSRAKGTRGGPNMEDTMTEEEFFEWLKNAAQAGGFENFAGSNTSEAPTTPSAAGFDSKSSGSSSNSKKRKKGKKQR